MVSERERCWLCLKIYPVPLCDVINLVKAIASGIRVAFTQAVHTFRNLWLDLTVLVESLSVLVFPWEALGSFSTSDDSVTFAVPAYIPPSARGKSCFLKFSGPA